MERKFTFYVSRKNGLTWLTALLMAASAVLRVTFACGERAGESYYLWTQVVLPVAACLLYAYLILCKGQEQFYKTAIPGFMVAAYLCFQTADVLSGSAYYTGLHCILYLVAAVYYARVVDGRVKHYYLLLLAYLLPLALKLYDYHGQLSVDFVTRSLIRRGADVLMLLAFGVVVLAMRMHDDGQYHPTWGDRSDGRRIRTLPAMAQVSPYIMVTRNTSTNFYGDCFEITNVERYIRQKRREGLTNFGIQHVILAAYVRCVAQYPGLNRFIGGQKVYSRGDDIQYCMTAKKEMSADSPDTVFKLHLSRKDTAQDVYEKFNAAVEKIKATPLNSNFDHTARALTFIPGVFLKFVVWLLRTLDYFGLLPKFLLEVSPFHGTVFFTSMGSLGIKPIYHHLYDFGNLPVFMAFGCKRRVTELNAEGEPVSRKYVDVKLCLDERIVDGFYYAAVLKMLKRLMAHPEVLDQPPEVIHEDID